MEFSVLHEQMLKSEVLQMQSFSKRSALLFALIWYRKEHKEEQEATEKDVTPKSSLGA